ncbi:MULTISPECIES: glycoside hydrolase family 88 protein [unclassified Polaribacter]|uniref:glycoside hydrolase family 88 protein n=1 Tax=unclassified Polaribacter TaxID=196858 RepID=UPI0011BE1278|nr:MULTISPECIES: glycoside hydrolase family 88 protein [unclassified Polaribacter]TXD53143.1 glucuronyl hydrolase [Polaribacter sp. IC063]TXD61263.1 glucuronyl hydrolase [Polaribacter sp. IC066]
MKRVPILIALCFFNSIILNAQEDIQEKEPITFNLAETIGFAESQFSKATSSLDIDKGFPRISNSDGTWLQVNARNWTSGFFPGSLWYLYELTGNKKWLKEAQKWTEPLSSLQTFSGHHDTGFMVYCSFGNGYRLTENKDYKDIIVNTSQTLTSRFYPNVGTIKSWDRGEHHITIIDNMMNLEMLMWASKNGGTKEMAKIAISHADTTLEHHFMENGAAYHGVVYNPETGAVINKRTYQGYNDTTMWARGQGWGIYGYSMMYKQTGDEKYLELALKTADLCIDRFPEDVVPYWDFDAPMIPKREKDASAGALMASAFLELYEHTNNLKYYNWAVKLLNELSSDRYLAKEEEYQCLILHSVGNYPKNSEVNVSLNYADYYYLEALVRLKKLSIGAQNN